jgi:hypothetical protein
MSEAVDIGLLIGAASQARDAGRLEEAEALAQMAVQEVPGSSDAQMALALVLLTAGRFSEGWPLYEARHIRKPALPFPEWDGRPVSRLLVYGEQGAGDQIMFARFAAELANRGTDVILFCHPTLERLFAQLPVSPIAMQGEVEFPDPEAWVMSNSLPGRLGVSVKNLSGAPYLRASPRRGAARIGIKARGNPAHHNDANRSLSQADEARLLRLPGAISLEPEATGARDFMDTAEIIAGLDLVIAVDTSTAHLAGALGKPVWILLPFQMTDWRWLSGRWDSPWYDSAMLFRQRQSGDWSAVIHEIENRLTSRARS